MAIGAIKSAGATTYDGTVSAAAGNNTQPTTIAGQMSDILNRAESNADRREAVQQSMKKEDTKIKDTIKEINKVVNPLTEAEFDYDDATNRMTIKIMNKDTQEIIREIPPEKTLAMIAKVWELAGLLVDEKR